MGWGWAWTGLTFWMNWLRNPRLNKAVHKVAVLTRIKRARVSSDKGMAVVLLWMCPRL